MKQQGINPFLREPRFIASAAFPMALPVSNRQSLEDAASFRYERYLQGLGKR